MILHDERRNLDLPVAGDAARLGRDPSLDLPFDPDDDIVSAVHARVWRERDGSWWLEDVGSTNGTWLNGSKVTEYALHNGDNVRAGETTFVFRLEEITAPG